MQRLCEGFSFSSSQSFRKNIGSKVAVDYWDTFQTWTAAGRAAVHGASPSTTAEINPLDGKTREERIYLSASKKDTPRILLEDASDGTTPAVLPARSRALKGIVGW